jgi:mannan endo-1,4-beta-mannosidase
MAHWLLLTVIMASTVVSANRYARAAEEIEHFITRNGDKLMNGDKEFRFVSFNIPNLHLVEDDFAPDKKTAWGWPTEFEITDALTSVDQMGGTVVRTYVLSVKREGSDMGEEVYVKGPGEFNEEAFQVLDLVLKIARDKGVRVFVPLVDQWWWMGGRAEYAAFRGKQPDDFWTDEQVIADFEKTIRYVLNRKNSLTGVAYKDDPTIFGWETGNEIKPPHEWTKRIAAFIKSIDSQHLVIDGNSLQGVSQEQLDDPNIDVITTHHYPQPGGNFIGPIRAAWGKCRGKKPYFVGEFGFIPATEFQQVLDLVVNEGISGALVWSLRYHHRDGGFYWHSEPLGAGLFKAYHWPGFATGKAYEETEVLDVMRKAAYKIRGLDVPPISKPESPKPLPIADPSAISWQGSAGATEYDVLRSDKPEGPWKVIGQGISDAAFPYAPLFNDDAAEVGESYYYSVVARNDSGKSAASKVMGPVKTKERTLVDHCLDTSQTDNTQGDVQFATGEDRKTREDSHRLKLAPGAAVIYRVDEPISAWATQAYFLDEDSMIEIAASVDGEHFEPCEVVAEERSSLKNDYNYLRYVVLEGDQLPMGAKYLRFKFPGTNKENGTAQLGRVVIHYGRIAE